MTLPTDAIFEADLGPGVALYDVSHLLPTHRAKVYRNRVGQPTEQYVHHSGRLGRPGFRGLYNSARYTVLSRGWPGTSYHTWIPREPLYDAHNRLVVLRGQPNQVRTYHAGTGPNERAVAHCLQGNTTNKPPTDSQLKCLAVLLDWYGLPVVAHCEAPTDGHPKPTCPGTHAGSFLSGYR